MAMAFCAEVSGVACEDSGEDEDVEGRAFELLLPLLLLDEESSDDELPELFSMKKLTDVGEPGTCWIKNML